MDPWDFSDSFASPDDRFPLTYTELAPVGNEAPLGGRVRIRPLEADFGQRIFGGPPLWSPDSRYVAIPEWTALNQQTLTMFDLQAMQEATSRERYAVLALQSFDDGIITGVDSPAYQPRPLSVSVESQSWAPLGLRTTRLDEGQARSNELIGCVVGVPLAIVIAVVLFITQVVISALRHVRRLFTL